MHSAALAERTIAGSGSPRRQLALARLMRTAAPPIYAQSPFHHPAQPESPMSASIVIVGAKRTAIGSMLGQFTGVSTTTLGATAIKAALDQSGVAPADVSEVIMGCVLPANLGQAPARQAAIA